MSRSGTYDMKYGFIPDDDGEMPIEVLPMTNGDRLRQMADRIRQMTNEELADQIVKCVEANFFRSTAVLGTKTNNKENWLDWLKLEADC